MAVGWQGEYEEPLELSQEGRDLLRRMLTVDPARRITTAQIMAHPWYRQGLPPGVDGYNEQLAVAPNTTPQSETDVIMLFEQMRPGISLED